MQRDGRRVRRAVGDGGRRRRRAARAGRPGRPLRRARPARRRRHGAGPHRARPGPRPAGGAQAGARPEGRAGRQRGPGPAAARGPGDGPPGPPERRRDPRRRHAGRPRLHGHGAGRGGHAGRVAGRRAARGCRDPGRLRPGRPRAGRRARRRHRAPRLQAGQRACRRRRPGAGDRLRPGPGAPRSRNHRGPGPRPDRWPGRAPRPARSWARRSTWRPSSTAATRSTRAPISSRSAWRCTRRSTASARSAAPPPTSWPPRCWPGTWSRRRRPAGCPTARAGPSRAAWPWIRPTATRRWTRCSTSSRPRRAAAAGSPPPGWPPPLSSPPRSLFGRAATPAPSCDGGAAFAAGAWDAPRRAAMRTAFAASGSPRASTVLSEATALLDRRAGEIARAHDASCRATQLTGEQSDEVLDLRASCLDRQREELAALTGLFARADAAVVGRALDAIYDLPPASECDAARVLAARVAAPPAAAAAQVADLRRDLAAAGALGLAGKYRESVAAARRIADAARKIALRPARGQRAAPARQVGDLHPRRSRGGGRADLRALRRHPRRRRGHRGRRRAVARLPDRGRDGPAGRGAALAGSGQGACRAHRRARAPRRRRAPARGSVCARGRPLQGGAGRLPRRAGRLSRRARPGTPERGPHAERGRHDDGGARRPRRRAEGARAGSGHPRGGLRKGRPGFWSSRWSTSARSSRGAATRARGSRCTSGPSRSRRPPPARTASAWPRRS